VKAGLPELLYKVFQSWKGKGVSEFHLPLLITVGIGREIKHLRVVVEAFLREAVVAFISWEKINGFQLLAELVWTDASVLKIT